MSHSELQYSMLFIYLMCFIQMQKRGGDGWVHQMGQAVRCSENCFKKIKVKIQLYDRQKQTPKGANSIFLNLTNSSKVQ